MIHGHHHASASSPLSLLSKLCSDLSLPQGTNGIAKDFPAYSPTVSGNFNADTAF